MEIIKKYLKKNLDKGFIEASLVLFAALILFVKKKDNSLRFYIDYRKFNELTKKDRYLLFLIAETLIRLNKVTVFIKLDIRQAFYRLYIYLDLKELITFRIRYRLYKYKVMPFGLYNGPGSY